MNQCKTNITIYVPQRLRDKLDRMARDRDMKLSTFLKKHLYDIAGMVELDEVKPSEPPEVMPDDYPPVDPHKLFPVNKPKWMREFTNEQP